MTPRPQLAAAARATQLTDAKEPVDLERVRTYHQHPGASKHQATALPSGQGMGRAAAFQRSRHALVANEKGNPQGCPSHRRHHR
jgi:hypothetical protein